MNIEKCENGTTIRATAVIEEPIKYFLSVTRSAQAYTPHKHCSMCGYIVEMFANALWTIPKQVFKYRIDGQTFGIWSMFMFEKGQTWCSFSFIGPEAKKTKKKHSIYMVYFLLSFALI